MIINFVCFKKKSFQINIQIFNIEKVSKNPFKLYEILTNKMACDCNCKCCRSKFLVIFFEQLFDISNSAGSLIVEAINLFRIFQKLSSTKRFATRFSSSCLRMFQWAKDFFHIIVNSLFRMRPFTDYESFSLSIFVFHFVIMTYITFINHTEEDLKAIVFFFGCI